MTNLLLLGCLMSFLSHCGGLEFTLTRNEGKLEDGKVCGILQCKEKKHRIDGVDTNTDLSQTTDTYSSISSLTVYKVVQREQDDKEYIRLATVNGKQTAFKKELDGVRISGLMSDGLATLRLQLTKPRDCHSEFMCEVRGVASQGLEKVSTAHLLQSTWQTAETHSEKVHESAMSPAAWQLLSLAQQMQVKLALVESSQQGMIHKIESFETEFRDTLGSLENRLEDKLSSGFKTINEKIWELDSKVSTFSSEASQVHDVKKEECGIRKEFLDILNATARLESTFNTASSALSMLEINYTQPQICGLMSQDFIANITQQLEEIVEYGTPVTLKDGLVLLEENLDRRLQLLESSINSSAANTQAVVYNLISEINVTILEELPSVLGNFIMPSTCRRYMDTAPFSSPKKHLVIYPRPGGILQEPYFCDTLTDGGGWIVIQRRTTGNVDFYRNWAAYKEGFGTLDDDFWLGNEKIYQLTSSADYELRVELKYEGDLRFAHYDSFRLKSEQSNYTLHVNSYSGTAGDSLSRHDGHQFTTLDRDNDSGTSRNCAQKFTGAWWYIDCHDSNLNGKWGAAEHKGLMWRALTGSNTVTFSEMKIRRVGA